MSDENQTKEDVAYFEAQGKIWSLKLHERYLGSCGKENRMFKSGFAWVKINGYSYICKIIERNEDDTLFTVELDDCIFTDVPVTALSSLRGDE